MFESIEFKNFKALRDTTLPLSQFTLIVGPNGSGKSTALQAFSALSHPTQPQFDQFRSVSVPNSTAVSLIAKWKDYENNYVVTLESRSLTHGNIMFATFSPDGQNRRSQEDRPKAALRGARVFALDAVAVARQVSLKPVMELTHDGGNLAGVLDRLRDQTPERFEELNEQLGRWIPEFDRLLFDTPNQGNRSIALRTRDGGHKIRADQLSQGTLIALTLLTIASMSEPPSIVCLEEPDHGLHPRLLRDVRDALYRLAYPDAAHEKREPVQVIATTHNPYFLDLFREHPEEIVIAEKVGLDATFSRLSDRSDLEEILGDAPLSEVWYSGVLGGVPAGT
jgi:predicted ATPase